MTQAKRTKTRGSAIAVALLSVPLSSCITVSPPDKPIEINLNVDIRQEVLVRLRDDVENLIQENPDAFPSDPPGEE